MFVVAAPDPTQNRGGTNVTNGPMDKWTRTGAMAELCQWHQRGFPVSKVGYVMSKFFQHTN